MLGVVVVCVLISILFVSVLTFLLWNRLHKGRAHISGDAPPQIGYAQWKEVPATDKFPTKGKCTLYDFGLQRSTLASTTLDRMRGRSYSPHESCTDSNQVFAAKVKRVCNLYVTGYEDTVVNHCYRSDGDTSHAKVGEVEYLYSSIFCANQGKKECKGSVSTMNLSGEILTTPLGNPKNVVLCRVRSPPIVTDDLYHITRFDHEVTVNSLGKYLFIRHKATGQVLTPSNLEQDAMWRIIQITNYEDPSGRDSVFNMLVYLGKPTPAEWKLFPESDQQFSQYALKHKMKVMSLNWSHSVAYIKTIEKITKNTPQLQSVVITDRSHSRV